MYERTMFTILEDKIGHGGTVFWKKNCLKLGQKKDG